MEHIAARDLANSSVEELTDALTPIFKGYTITVPRVQADTSLFRGVVGAKPTFLSNIKYPPADRVRSFERLNRPGQSLMYTATMRAPVPFELDASEGTELVIAEWRTTEKIIVNAAGYTAGCLQTLGSDRSEPSWAGEGLQQEPTNRLVQEFLGAQLTRRIAEADETRYKLTVAIAEKMFTQDGFDGFLYPTVAMRGNADNIALKPAAADTKLRFHRAEWMRVTRVAGSSLDIKIIDTATQADPEGRILWRGRGDIWVLRSPSSRVSFRVEDGRWVARNGEGAIIDPE